MESSVPQKLESLVKLQELDNKLDDIKKIRGALPDEVSDLEDEIVGYETRLKKFDVELEELENGITEKKNGIKESEKLIQKYTEQQMNVRNNREYDALTKEIELQNLEIQISEKRIKEAYAKIEHKKVDIDRVKEELVELNKDLESKKSELDTIVAESEGEEKTLLESREKAAKKVDDRLFRSYEKIRGSARNGLAVVSVKRAACGGCFNIVPPQRQADIKDKKKIIVCEHCGRILADVELVIVDETKPKRTTRRKKATK